MSIQKPPRSGSRTRPVPAAEPDYESSDLLPGDSVGPTTWDEGPPADGSRVGTTGEREVVNGRGRNGRAAVAAPPAESEPREEAAEPTVEPGVAAAVARSAAAGPELSLWEWLNRRWVYGLTYWQTLLVVGLFLTLLITRFVDLGDKTMHHDESMHAKFAWDTFHGNPIYRYNPLLHGPFQFLAVATSFWIFGATEATARAVPAVFGVVLVCLTFVWRRWLGTAGWLFAAAILIFSPSFTYYARMLREDSYVATWTLLAATGLVGYILASTLGPRRRAWYYTFCCGLAFAFATKESTYITAFIFGTFMCLSLLWEHATTAQRRMIAGAAAGAILGAFWSPVMGFYKKELHEVGGAVIGLVAGGLLGFVYHQVRPRRRAAVVDATGRPLATARARRRARELARQDRPPGTFTAALVALWQDRDGFWGLGTFWGGVIVFFAIFIVLFSSLFTNWPGIREGMIGSIRYWLEQHGVQRGNQPWFYYLILLSVYETLPWVIGLAGTVYYLRKPSWVTTFLIWWWVVALVIYSWAGEKMPWLIIHIATPLVLLSGRYLGELATDAARNVWEKRLAFGGTALLALWALHTGWPVNFERPDTPKDMLVYTQSAPDVKKVMRDIERISLEQTADSRGIGVVVQSGTWWPFSWYLRDFKNAEYPANLTAQATKPIALIAVEDDEKNRPFLQGYARTKYKMRWWYPEDYRSIPDEIKKSGGLFQFVGRKDVRDGLWKWLIYRDTTQPLGSYDFYLYVKEGLGVVSGGAATGDLGPLNPPSNQAGLAGAGNTGAQPPRVNLEQYAARTVPLTPVLQWGTNGKNTGQLNTPRGVALDAQGNVYVADTLNHRIQKFDRSGKLLTAWGTEGNGNGQFKEPMGVAIGPDGSVYVADTWNHRIQKFDSAGKFIAQWPGQGGFWGPRGIALDGQGNVYVTDTGNKRIQKFDKDGKFLAQFGTGGAGPGQLNEPIGIAVSPTGEVVVADTNNRRVQKFDFTGKLLAEWPIGGWQTSARTEPYVALDPDGNVYVTDPPNARIVKFGPTGEVLAVAGGLGKAPNQVDVPLGIAVGDAIYVADSNNHRIAAFGRL